MPDPALQRIPINGIGTCSRGYAIEFVSQLYNVISPRWTRAVSVGP
jgi:hypothetical protein